MKTIDEFQGEYRWLSNFWPASVALDGMLYPTVEHAYQAAKTLDAQSRARIQLCGTPGIAKRMGRAVLVRSDWEKVKVSIMRDLVRQKFQEPSLKAKLLATGNAQLVESNYWNDTFWGVCRGVGRNELGKILMQVREELKL